MISLFPLLVLLWSHFVADFVLQTDWMAKNKSSNHDALAVHILTYSAALAIMTAVLPFGIGNRVLFIALNGALHLWTDFFTSRAAKALYAKGEIHWFFVVIGMGQALHMSLLFTTYTLLAKS